MDRKFIEGKWLNQEEVIDFLVERVFILQARIEHLENGQVSGRRK